MTNTPNDPRPLFASAFATAGKVIAGVRPDQYPLPTPCADFDVEGLLGHLRMVAQRAAQLGRGEPAFDSFDAPPAPADGDQARWWQEAGHDIQEAWTDQRLTDTITLPWATVSGADALAGYLNELNLHAWDLAAATGQDVAWDDEAVAAGWAALQAVLPGQGRTTPSDAMPEHLRHLAIPFNEPVPWPADAPLIEQAAAWSGRDPGPWHC